VDVSIDSANTSFSLPFAENSIEDELFLNMTPEMINKVIPASVYGYGPQWKLERKLDSLRAASKIVSCSQ